MSTVKFGSEIVLQHVETRHYLSSPGVPYTHPKTSGQDQVTCISKPNATSTWIVKPPDGYPSDHRYGQAVKQHDFIRLENRATGKNLHSHSALSPISGHLEVTGFGDKGMGDMNDNWRVELPKSGDWNSDAEIRLIHTLTNGALHSHNCSHPQFTSGQLEVTGHTNRDTRDLWTVAATSGPIVFLATPGTKAQSWVALLNLAGSVASVTGISFLFLGASFKTSSVVKILSAFLTSLLVIGVVAAICLSFWEGNRWIRTRLKTSAWLIVLWTIGLFVGFVLVFFLWDLGIRFVSTQLQPVIRRLFGVDG